MTGLTGIVKLKSGDCPGKETIRDVEADYLRTSTADFVEARAPW